MRINQIKREWDGLREKWWKWREKNWIFFSKALLNEQKCFKNLLQKNWVKFPLTVFISTFMFIRYDDDCEVDADKFCCFRNSPHFSCFLLLIQVDSGCQCSIFYSVATWHRFLLKNISICHLIVNTFFEISLRLRGKTCVPITLNTPQLGT